jgi:hypothetical protein
MTENEKLAAAVSLFFGMAFSIIGASILFGIGGCILAIGLSMLLFGCLGWGRRQVEKIAGK